MRVPWHVRSPEPMLRSVPDAARVARLLSQALAASAEQPVQIVSAAVDPAPAIRIPSGALA